MIDRGLFVTSQAIRRQWRAMPCELYLIRLIHHATGRAFPGERVWTAQQVSQPATVRFLRIRNREGCPLAGPTKLSVLESHPGAIAVGPPPLRLLIREPGQAA